MCYDLPVKRQITYRTAANLFLFLGLWFAIGGIALLSPIPGALGIGRDLFSVWLILFFIIMAVAGGALVAASVNAARSTPRGPSPRTAPAARTPAGEAASPRPDAGAGVRQDG
jgi:hypothetical protein